MRFLSEQIFNPLEQANLLLNGVPTCLRNINHVKNTSLEMGKSSDTLHLDGVHTVDVVIQDTGGVNHLPLDVVVVGVSHEKGLSGEGIWLDLHIGMRDIVDEAGLAHIGETAQQDGPGEGVDRGESAKMLSYLLEEAKT